MTTKRKKPETWWCIASGTILLPYTARTTRREAIAECCQHHRIDRLYAHQHAVKLSVSTVRLPRRRVAPTTEGK